MGGVARRTGEAAVVDLDVELARLLLLGQLLGEAEGVEEAAAHTGGGARVRPSVVRAASTGRAAWHRVCKCGSGRRRQGERALRLWLRLAPWSGYIQVRDRGGSTGGRGGREMARLT